MPKLNATVVPVTPFQQNCSIFWNDDDKKATVIDPGGDVERIREILDQAGLTVEAILLTHGHIDHAGGADELRELTGAKITGPHEADRMLLENLEKQGDLYGMEGVRNVAPDRWLEEGDTIAIAGQDFEVFHAPGHSPGSVIFVSKPLGFAIVGDVLFAGSIGRTDLPGGSHETLLSSIRDKLLPLDDSMAFLCGHGPGSKIGDERKSNPFLAGL